MNALILVAALFTGTVTGPNGAVAGAEVQVGTNNALTNAAGAFSMQVPNAIFRVTVVPPAGSGLRVDDAVNGFDFSVPVTGRFRLTGSVRVAGQCLFPPAAPARYVAIYSLTGARAFAPPADFITGTFEQQLPPDHYSIQCSAFAGSTYYAGRANVDATTSNAVAAPIALAANARIVSRTPPRASLISIGPADAHGVADVTGVPGAVEPRSSVVVANLDSQQIALTVSRADGSFAARMFAPPGSHIQVKHDPTGRYLPKPTFNGTLNELAIPAGTILYVPPAPATFAAVGTIGYYLAVNSFGNFDLQERFGTSDPGQWWVRGTFDPAAWAPGRSISMRGTMTLYSRNITAATDLSQVKLTSGMMFDRIFNTAGGAQQPMHQFMSSLMTPTGLPVERYGGNHVGGQMRISALRYVEPYRIEADWSYDGQLPNNLLPGIYQPRFTPQFQGLGTAARHFDIFASVESGPGFTAALPLVRIGNPAAPRMFWVLGLDDLDNGLRGSVAVEDRGKFQVMSHVAIPSDVRILPPRDARTGEPIRYRLEPFVPMQAMSTARLTDPPPIPLRFPSGSLTVRVRKPDGTVDDLGSAPFAQSMSSMPVSRTGETITGSSSSVSDYYQLTTLQPQLDYAFTQYGRYEITMSGFVEDVYGNRYDGGGTYEVIAARHMDLESAVLPGTPFHVGESPAPAFVVQPPVPAEIEVTVRFAGQAGLPVLHTFRGRANRFGYARVAMEMMRFSEPGEYRIDVTATHVGEDGVWWAGTATWGSVVATPVSPLRTKGRRGFDLVNEIQQQWFTVRDTRKGGDHVMFPFHAGDVMWLQKNDPAADIPKITIQDTQGAFAARLRPRHGPMETPSMEERIAAGEIPLYSWSNDGDVSSVPELADQWGYFYAYAERPGVRVRELISEDSSGNGYWRFSDNYHFQLGNGMNGDLPNDFKFHFGGAVFRDLTDGFRYYGAYASLFVLLPFDDAVGGRVMPPFQGNGGGPDGGPLFRLKGQDVDLFLHPTGVRAGTILHTGEIASFSGYVAPTLPALVEIIVTSPSGAQRTIRGRASAIGYFHPRADFAVSEPGVWRANVRVVFDGLTSAGQVTVPFPSSETSFVFYVVDGASPQLELAALPAFVRPADGPIALDVVPPAGLTNLQLAYSTTMPGFVLEEGSSASLRYRYDAPALASVFPNLDLHDRDGYAGADTITISLLLSGTDAAGARRHFARQVVIQGEEVQMPVQRPVRKTRAVR